jgi:chaperonin GroES
MNIKPLYDRIAVEPIQEEKTQGGIIIPDTAKDKPSKGKVVAVGAGYRSDDGSMHPLTVKIGDVVMYAKWGGSEVKVNDKDLMIMKESDILAICTA